MRIIIIGDGKVGYKLAKQLSAEKYDIIMIDSNENKVEICYGSSGYCLRDGRWRRRRST